MLRSTATALAERLINPVPTVPHRPPRSNLDPDDVDSSHPGNEQSSTATISSSCGGMIMSPSHGEAVPPTLWMSVADLIARREHGHSSTTCRCRCCRLVGPTDCLALINPAICNRKARSALPNCRAESIELLQQPAHSARIQLATYVGVAGASTGQTVDIRSSAPTYFADRSAKHLVVPVKPAGPRTKPARHLRNPITQC